MTRLLILFCVLCPFGDAFAQTTQYQWKVEGVPLAEVPLVARALEGRFKEVRQGLWSSVSAQASGDRVLVVCQGWTPAPAVVDRLAAPAGRFRVYLEGSGTPLISESDVVDAQPLSRTAGVPELGIRLRESAIRRVSAATENAIGRMARVEWEDQVLIRLNIAGPIPAHVGIAMPSADDAIIIGIILRSPRMPAGAKLVRQQ